MARTCRVVTVSVTDAQGRVVPVAGNAIAFSLDGPGRIIGVGNGDPSCHEPDVFVAPAATHSVPIDVWRWKMIADPYAEDLPEAAATVADSAWDKADVTSESGPLVLRQKGIFRGHFTVSAQDLAAPAVDLVFGSLNGGGNVFVNGVKIGPAGDARTASIYHVKALLHPGENTVAVALANYGAAAGVNKGAWLRYAEPPRPVAWSRSVFNGLAQVIVQATKEPGAITLTARAEGLKPATVAITANPATPRPAVP